MFCDCEVQLSFVSYSCEYCSHVLSCLVSSGQVRNAQVRRVRLADGCRLRGALFPEFTVFIPKNREYLAQLSVRSTRKKASGGAKMAIRGAKLTFSGGKFFLGVF